MQLNNTCFRLALRPFLILAVVMTTSIFIVGSVCGQAEEDPVAETSAINQRLSQLESELGKYKDSAPEAANLMLQLVNR